MDKIISKESIIEFGSVDTRYVFVTLGQFKRYVQHWRGVRSIASNV